MSKKESLRDRKIYSESLRRHIVGEIEKGNLTVSSACKVYDIGSRQTVYEWIYRYSKKLEKGTLLVMEEDSLSKKIKDLERKTKELEAALGRKQMEVDIYRTLIEIAEEDHGIKIKKKDGDDASND